MNRMIQNTQFNFAQGVVRYWIQVWLGTPILFFNGA